MKSLAPICSARRIRPRRSRGFLSRKNGFLYFLENAVPLERVKSKADVELFRLQLAIFSIVNLGKDTRDAILWRDALYTNARAAGIDIAPHVREITALSSNINAHGMGSTQDVLRTGSGIDDNN